MKTSVLIVGGGPVGLVMAIELARRGVECVLVEARDGTINTPKMNFVNVRSMEFCRRWGIAEAVRRAGHDDDFAPNVVWTTALTEHVIARLDFPPLVDWKDRGYSPEASCLCSQLWFDPILLDHARSLPALDIRHRTQCESFSATGDGITAKITDLETGGPDTIDADYIIGCDGANSMVRAQLGIDLGGLENMALNLHVFFESAELLAIYGDSIGTARFCWFVDESGVWGGFTSINGRGLWRLGVTPPEDDPQGATLDLPGLIRKGAGTDFDFDILSTHSWISRKLVAETYRRGRAFLVGDSAHQLNPSGGFGMNTGLGEAADLAWKLDAVLAGWGGRDLLASYEIERRPIAVRNVEEATRNFRRRETYVIGAAITADSATGRQQRRQFEEALFANNIRRHYEVEGIGMGYRYDPSPICWPDGTMAPADDAIAYVPTARPGHRAPHAWIKPGVSTLDKFGDGFTLLRLGAAPADASAPAEAAALVAAAKDCGLPLAVVDIESPEIAALYEKKLVLVRPDGHVAWRGNAVGGNAAEIIDRVRGAGG